MTKTYSDTPEVGSIYKDRVPEGDSGDEYLCIRIDHDKYPSYQMVCLSNGHTDYYHCVDWEYLRKLS